MLEPRGPLPPSVYWRRRWTALAALLVAVAMLVWAILAAAGAATQAAGSTVSTAEVAAAADPRPLPGDPPSETATPAAGQAPGAPASPPAPEDERARPETPAVVAGQAPPGPGQTPAAAPPAAAPSDASPPPSAAAPASPAAAPEGPCPDQVIGVAAQVGAPQYNIGERPVFRLVIVNNGPVPCERDLDAALQELGLFTGNGAKKLWSSNDCFPGQSKDVRTLRPGEPATFAVTWSGRTSGPGCRGDRTAVGPGEYRLLSRLGGIISAPTQFQLVP